MKNRELGLKKLLVPLIKRICIGLTLILIQNASSVAQPHAGHQPSDSSEKQHASTDTITINMERLQSIGVKFEEAKSRSVEKIVRTVGRVEMDEKLVAHVTVKIQGWIDDLYVNTTGQKINKGDLLFTLHSPDLIATQQEYLLAFNANRKHKKSARSELSSNVNSTLQATRERLRFWGIEDSHIKELETTGKILQSLPFHTPLSGTVINKIATKGMSVEPGKELYTIADLSKVWLIADIYEYELPIVQLGQVAKVTLSYNPQAKFEGKIGFVYPTVDSQTRTGKVRLEIDNPNETLKPGMFANIELAIPLGSRLVIPKDAVLETGVRQVIFIHHGGGKLEWRNVKIGVRSGDWVEILEGLKEGEHIVTSANFLIDSESQLKSAFDSMAGMGH
jgi:membrane fusion protein, copper/silver efflux system